MAALEKRIIRRDLTAPIGRSWEGRVEGHATESTPARRWYADNPDTVRERMDFWLGPLPPEKYQVESL